MDKLKQACLQCSMYGIFSGIFQNIYFEIAAENQTRSISSVGFD